MNERFIVAEVSKNWIDGEPYDKSMPTVGRLFEDIVNTNHERGYRLHSFTLHRLVIRENEMNETVIAVFERRPDPGIPTERHGA